ncbi:hypothetical protein [Tuberibacillus sp. Marseille-P3662]|nr:hypothetical protein [Tuberibacillus sp. Marseille-P3662]
MKKLKNVSAAENRPVPPGILPDFFLKRNKANTKKARTNGEQSKKFVQ